MAQPFIRFVSLPGRPEPDALAGFTLPFLPDMLTSRWLSGSNEMERLHQALRLQQRLVSSLWASGITAWDLRFIGMDDLPGVAIGLLCRLSRPARVPSAHFQAYCIEQARRVQQLFADCGYELLPLEQDIALARYLTPFSFQSVADVRRHEELLLLQSTYNEYEVYVTYPWQWAAHNRLRLFEALLGRQSNCLVSIYLEPTQLSPQEQAHLSHATSPQVRDLLQGSGPQGETIYNIYQDYVRHLRQPYLVRISIAAATPQTLQQIGRMLQDELNAAQPLGAAERVIAQRFSTPQASGTGPRVTFPQHTQEWQWACHSLANVTWHPWGRHHGADSPGTARLRYLTDDIGASMSFRFPIVRAQDLPGVPVRSLSPTTHPGGAPVPSFHSMPTASSTQSAVPTHKTPQITHTPPPTASAIRRPQDLIGQMLGNCLLEELIGQGGFGAVYRATQPHLNRQVAVKVVLDTLSNSDQQKRRKLILRFDREAQAVARLDHPHILGLYEYQSGDLPYLVMPYMAKGSLADEIKASRNRPLPLSGITTILIQIASALDHAHQQRLVHRDMKPDNLLRHADERIMVSDFGIVQFEDDDLTALTVDGHSSPYTPSYASPEQHRGLPVDYHTDIYSLGVIMYELLCGQRPFPRAFGHVFTSPPTFQSLGVQVPPAIEAVVVRALAKQPDQRYPSAGAMAKDFQQAMKG